MIHLFKPFAIKLWALAVTLIILFGAVTAVIRLVLPLASGFRENIEALMSASAGAPVEIGSFGAGLRGFSVQLVLGGVRLLNAETGREQLRFREARLNIDVFNSLRSGQLEVASVELVGARLVLKRRTDGSLVLVGLEGEQAGGGQSLGFFLESGRLSLSESDVWWENQTIGAPPLHFTHFRVNFANEGERHQLAASARLPGQTRGQVRFRADFFGDPEVPHHWRGDLYMKVERMDLAALWAARVPRGYRLETGRTDLEIWSRWQAGMLADVQGSVSLRQLAVAEVRPGAGREARQLNLDWLRSAFRWRRETGGWRLDLADFALARGGRVWPQTTLSLRTRLSTDGSFRLQAGAGLLRVEDLLAVANLFPIGDGSPNRILDGLRPEGELRDLRFVVAQRRGAAAQWSVSGRLGGMSYRPWHSMPGIDGLDFAFRADQAHGVAELAADAVTMTYPGMFRQPLRATRLEGALRWRHEPGGGLELGSRELLLENPDVRTRSRLALRLPEDGSSPFLDLQVDFRDANGSAVHRYQPVGIMDAELVAWIDRAIVSGRVPSGSVIFRGPLAAFPFAHREGRFQAVFGVKDAVLDYHEGWPRLEEILAEVRFLDQRLEIEAEQAKLLESTVRPVSVSIRNLRLPSPATIRGQATGPFADVLRVLRETPLAADKAAYVRGMTALGHSRVHLNISLPVDGGGPFRVGGGIRWNRQAALRLDDFDVTLGGLDGELRFDQDGVYGRTIRADLWGNPVALSLDTIKVPGPEEPTETLVKASFPIDVAQLASRYPQAPGMDLLRGRAEMQLRLSIPHPRHAKERPRMRFRLSSSLEGIQVLTPAPLGKKANQVRELWVSGALSPGPEMQLEGRYDRFSIALALQRMEAGETRVVSGEISCGAGTARVPSVSGLRLVGELERLDLAEWLDWLRLRGASPRSDREADHPPIRVDLNIRAIAFGGLHLDDAHVEALRTPHAWEADLASNRLVGSIRLPDDFRSQAVSVQLKRLDLNLDDWLADAESVPGSSTPAADPRRAPAIYGSVDQLSLNGHPVGRLQIRVKPIAEGLRLERFSIQGPMATIQGHGCWTGTPLQQWSRLGLELQSGDFGKLLRYLEFTSFIDRAGVDARLDASWPASPLALTLPDLNGTLDIHIGKGRVLELDPGLGRVIGLFNLGALQRRLTLDFSDLFKEGYTFDRIDGHFEVAEGVAFTRDLVIDGPAARVDVEGVADLVEQEYDQRVTVTPRISSSLAVAGAVAGGPVVGAALLLAQQVLGDRVDQFSRYQYLVSGPWRDPSFIPVNTEDGWSLSNLWRRPAPDETAPKSPGYGPDAFE